MNPNEYANYVSSLHQYYMQYAAFQQQQQQTPQRNTPSTVPSTIPPQRPTPVGTPVSTPSAVPSTTTSQQPKRRTSNQRLRKVSNLPPSYTESPVQTKSTGDPNAPIVTKEKLRDLLRQLEKEQTMDMDVEDLFLDLAHEFIVSTTQMACKLAAHRDSELVQVNDVALPLEKHYNIRIPGFDNVQTYKLNASVKPDLRRSHRSKVGEIGKTVRESTQKQTEKKRLKKK